MRPMLLGVRARGPERGNAPSPPAAAPPAGLGPAKLGKPKDAKPGKPPPGQENDPAEVEAACVGLAESPDLPNPLRPPSSPEKEGSAKESPG